MNRIEKIARKIVAVEAPFDRQKINELNFQCALIRKSVFDLVSDLKHMIVSENFSNLKNLIKQLNDFYKNYITLSQDSEKLLRKSKGVEDKELLKYLDDVRKDIDYVGRIISQMTFDIENAIKALGDVKRYLNAAVFMR